MGSVGGALGFGILLSFIIILLITMCNTNDDTAMEFSAGMFLQILIILVIFVIIKVNLDFDKDRYVRYSVTGEKYTCEEYAPLVKLVCNVDSVVTDSVWNLE